MNEQVPAPEKKGCLANNWKKIVGCGCLLVLLLCGGGIGTTFFGVVSVLKSSDVYQDAVKAAKASPEVEKALGSPIAEGFMPSGSINTTNGNGTADLTIPISGPKGSGTIHVVGTSSSGGKWKYTTLEVDIKDAGPIDLLEKDK